MVSVKKTGVEYIAGEEIAPSNMSKGKVEDYACTVADMLNFQVGDDPARVVGLLGGRIRYQELGDILAEGGSIFVHGPNDFDILLPHYTSPVRDRFTVAHELGHYFLHSRQGKVPVIAYRSGSSRIEWEANWFAAGLLMPKEPFSLAVKQTPDLITLASRFGVSPEAARVRKDALGL